MKQRIKTGLVLFFVVCVCMFGSKQLWPMQLMLIATSVIASSEWRAIMPALAYRQIYPIVVGLVSAGILILPQLALPFMPITKSVPLIWPILWAGSGIVWLLTFRWVWVYPTSTSWYGWWLSLVGLLLISAAVSSIFALWLLSPWWLMYVFFIIWAADVGAYVTGRLFGKHKLARHVSPGKTIEGFAGGLFLALCFIALVVFTTLHFTGKDLIVFVVASVATALLSVQGDLFESMLKRRANIKDSGWILPGHGGVLDRIDSILSAAPAFALFFFWFRGF